MKIYIAILCALCIAVAAGVVFGGIETNRFHGASYDGYDQKSVIQTTTDFDLIYARFTGGSYDGYDLNSVTNFSIPVTAFGTIFFIK